MLRNCWRSFMYSMGLVAIIFIIFSLVFPESVGFKHIYHMVCILIPSHLFSLTTIKQHLFVNFISKRSYCRMLFIQRLKY